MGKHKNKENPQTTKKNTVVFKLVHRDSSDPNYDESNPSANIVYQLVQFTKDEFLTEEEKSKRDRLIGLFSDKDRGIFDPAKARKKVAPPPGSNSGS